MNKPNLWLTLRKHSYLFIKRKMTAKPTLSSCYFIRIRLNRGAIYYDTVFRF